MKKDYKNLIQNMGVFVLTNFTTKILNFLFLPVYTFYLSTEEYGTIDIVGTIISLLFPFLSLAIVDAVFRFGLSEPSKKEEFFSIGCRVLIWGSIIIGSGTAIASMFIKDDILLISFLGIYVCQSVNQLFAAFAKVLNKVRQMSVITVITSGTILLLNIIFIVFFRWGIRGYWFATILGNLVSIILYFVWCKIYRFYRRSSYNTKGILKKMLKYSIPLIPNALFWWINSSLDRWALVFMTNLSVVGLYSCANKIPILLSTLNNIFAQAWNLSLFQNSNDNERKLFFENVYFYYNEIMFCCTIVIICFSKFIALYMFSKNFFEAWHLVPLLTFGVYYNSLNAFLGSLFTAGKKTKYIFTTTLAGSFTNFLLNFIFVYAWGGEGAALATLISYLVVWIVRTKRVSQIFDIHIPWKTSVFQLLFLIVESLWIMLDKLCEVVVVVVALYCVIFLFRVYGKIKDKYIETKI